MNREILFKAKRIDNGEWCYFGLFEKYPENVINPDTICQYVGINDAKGDKIFEFDDVISQYGSIYNLGSLHNIIASFTDNKHRFDHLTVIGNIHD